MSTCSEDPCEDFVCTFDMQQSPACVTPEPAACHHDTLLIQKDRKAAMQYRAGRTDD